VATVGAPVPVPAPVAVPVVQAKVASPVVAPKAVVAPKPAFAAPKPADMMAGYEQLMKFGRAQMQAFLATTTEMASGVSTLSSELAAFTQGTVDRSVTASRAIYETKSLYELFDLTQAAYKAQFGAMVDEGNKLTHMSTELAQKAAAPLKGRVDAAVASWSRLG
jgi:hypothetical protein